MTDFFFALLKRGPAAPGIDPRRASRKQKIFLALSTGPSIPTAFTMAGGKSGKRHAAHQRYTGSVETPLYKLSGASQRKRFCGNLLELEAVARKPRDIERIPPDRGRILFFEVGKLCREADSFLAQRGNRTTLPRLLKGRDV